MPLRILAIFALILCLSGWASAADEPDLAGDWSGLLELGSSIKLPLIFHITETDEGYEATIESPEQNAIAPATMTIDGNTVRFIVTEIDINYEATVSGDTMTGTFKQFGQVMEDYTLTRE